MSNDIRHDKDGYVYERNPDGSYDKKWDNGAQDYAREHVNLNYQSDGHSRDGTPLFGSPEPAPGQSTSGGGGDDIVGRWCLAIVLPLIILTQLILATPVIAPIILHVIDKARRSGDLEKVNKWRLWSIAALILATIVTFLYALTVAIGSSLGFVTLTKHVDTPLIIILMCLFAQILAIIVFVLMFVTGMSPTALVYLHQKESGLRMSGDLQSARKIRLASLVIGITAATTFTLWLLVGFIGLVTGNLVRF